MACRIEAIYIYVHAKELCKGIISESPRWQNSLMIEYD